MNAHPQTGFTTLKQAEQLLWNAAQKISAGSNRLESLMIQNISPNLKQITKEAKGIKRSAAELIESALGVE